MMQVPPTEAIGKALTFVLSFKAKLDRKLMIESLRRVDDE
jgi:hypothetical protein